MDLKAEYLLTLVSGLGVFLVFACYQIWNKNYGKRKKCTVPRAGGALPIIGHMHLLGGKKPLYKVLEGLADQYGPAFMIKLGSKETLVVSDLEVARECFTTHDKAFADRPRIAASELLTYNFAMFGFAPYGPYWREMRKIATLELLSNRRVEMLEHIRASEVKTSIKELYVVWERKRKDKGEILVDMKQWFGDLMHNTSVRMVGGKRFFGASADIDKEEARSWQKLNRDLFKLFGVFVLSDAIPFLWWLDPQGYKKSMKKTAKEFDKIIEVWLQEHKQRRQVAGENRAEQDFMDVLLNILEDATISEFDVDTIVKATCLNMIVAGSDTPMVTLTWALSLLLNNAHALEKAREELDSHVSKDRHVKESDIRNLVYLQAIVKETLRLYPPAPIIGLRSSMEECTISAGNVPSGTRLMLNAWKIHHDERLWPEPNKFNPERFLTSHKHIDIKGQNFELLPFGSGRRSCPGISLALQMVHLALASLLHCFEITRPSDGEIDMTGSIGLTNLKATPLEVHITPRLPCTMYG